MITAVGKGFIATQVSYGLGQHRRDLSVGQYRNFLRYYYADTLQFFIALATCKVSICLFLLRLSQFHKLKKVLYGIIAFQVVTTVVLCLLYALQCNPVHKVWDQGTPGVCFSGVVNVSIVQGVFSFLTDFVLAAFPIVLLRNLNVKRHTKYGLCMLMGLGVITGAVAIARVATTFQTEAYDLSWDANANTMMKMFEVNIGNTAACVPLFKPFGRYIHAKYTGQDPRELFYRKPSDDSQQHAHWYTKYWNWRSRSRSTVDDTGPPPQSLPAGVVRMKATHSEEKSSLPPGVVIAKSTQEDTSSRRSRGSLTLPLQGARYDHSEVMNIPPVPDIRVYGTRRGLHENYAEMFDPKNIV